MSKIPYVCPRLPLQSWISTSRNASDVKASLAKWFPNHGAHLIKDRFSSSTVECIDSEEVEVDDMLFDDDLLDYMDLEAVEEVLTKSWQVWLQQRPFP